MVKSDTGTQFRFLPSFISRQFLDNRFYPARGNALHVHLGDRQQQCTFGLKAFFQTLWIELAISCLR